MTNHFKILLSKNARILIYNGDVDTVCSVIMNGIFTGPTDTMGRGLCFSQKRMGPVSGTIYELVHPKNILSAWCTSISIPVIGTVSAQIPIGLTDPLLPLLASFFSRVLDPDAIFGTVVITIF